VLWAREQHTREINTIKALSRGMEGIAQAALCWLVREVRVNWSDWWAV
jgi:hypothetical protein